MDPPGSPTPDEEDAMAPVKGHHLGTSAATTCGPGHAGLPYRRGNSEFPSRGQLGLILLDLIAKMFPVHATCEMWPKGVGTCGFNIFIYIYIHIIILQIHNDVQCIHRWYQDVHHFPWYPWTSQKLSYFRVQETSGIHTCLLCRDSVQDIALTQTYVDCSLDLFRPPAQDKTGMLTTHSVPKTSKAGAQLVEVSSNWALKWLAAYHAFKSRLPIMQKLCNCACKPNSNAETMLFDPYISMVECWEAVVGVQLSHDGNLVLSQAQVRDPRSTGRHNCACG